MELTLNPNSIQDYRTFLKIKSLPTWRIRGRTAYFPDEYASRIVDSAQPIEELAYRPSEFLFDYQRDITALALRKRKFAIFAECGLGKTLIFLEYARTVLPNLAGKLGLMVSPAMVVDQTIEECRKFYGDDIPIVRVAAKDLQDWLNHGDGLGITNYEALKHSITPGRLGMLIIDESSMLKSHYGKWGTKIIELGRGLEWKLAGTGTPAPNDRIEYANHAILLDAFPTVNSFLAKFFVNRGQTGERWELKQHALGAFYRALSHWCIFLTDPEVYGWKDNVQTSMPPIHVHIHDVDLTREQEVLAYKNQGVLFAKDLGGISSRASYGQIAKGHYKGKRLQSLKPTAIRQLVESWPTESTIIWCLYDAEQDIMEETFPAALSMRGSTPMDNRREMIGKFQRGEARILISKPKVLGFGLNLQIATRQVFSGLQDSYEAFHQCVKRSNRVGSTRPLNVHIPVTDIERPMIETVLTKCRRVEHDAAEQERIFRQSRCDSASDV